jgi:hypothetical protein
MPSFSGSFSGQTNSQAMLAVKDEPGHEVGIMEVTGPQVSSDPLWNGATVSYWGIADLVGGNGTQTGYFMNRHVNGDIDHGTFEARVTTEGNAVTMQGTWKLVGGTGQFARLSGSGTYTGRMTSPTEVETSWEGSYHLG